MSRCFPFPPPGYEKEARTYDLDLLKKEKERERKLKKEKKNREKKEGKDKEKKEKDRSDGKHREKKEKKDKHRDKKDKDRDKDKEKSTRDDTRLPKLVEPRVSLEKPSDEKTLLPPSRPEANSGEILRHKGKEPGLDRNSLLGDKKVPRPFPGHSEKSTQNSQVTDRGIKDRKSVEKFPGAVTRQDEGTVRLVANSTASSSDGKEKIKTSGDRKSNDQVVKNGLRFTGNVTPQSFPGINQPKFENSSKPLENDKSKKKEDDKRKEKQKDRDKEEAKAKQRSQQKKMEPDRLKETDAVTGIYTAKPPQVVDESIKNPVTGENPKKRKDLETHGFLSANDIKPGKVPKPTQNGRVPGAPGWQEAVNRLPTDSKEHVLNGVKSSLARTISTTPPPPTKPLTTPPKPVQPPRKPPHPDVEYLNEVLSVPKMAEWSDHDDQKWLFEGGDSQPKKPKVGPPVGEEIPKVWSEALRIESADICALPYVIPY